MRKGITLALCVALILMSFGIGYKLGLSNSTDMANAKGNLALSMALNEFAEREDWGALTNSLGIYILGQVRSYEAVYGQPSGTNRFTQLYHKAADFADEVESRLKPLSTVMTNLTIESGSTVRFINE